jgi:hypothetical protein
MPGVCQEGSVSRPILPIFYVKVNGEIRMPLLNRNVRLILMLKARVKSIKIKGGYRELEMLFKI